MAVREGPDRQFCIGPLVVKVYEDRELLGRAAAQEAAGFLREAISNRGKARVVFASADSQKDLLMNLTAMRGIDWNSVEAFHMDEYVGLPTSDPRSFGGWLKRHVADKVHLRDLHYIAGDAGNIEEECQRYAEALTRETIDLCLLGIGENAHIAFNDPHEADFGDRHVVKVVTLDERCRRQQLAEGNWPDLASVPKRGITITCPALVKARHLISCVPGPKKAEAVRETLEGSITPACPASVLRTCRNTSLYLDKQSASLLRVTGCRGVSGQDAEDLQRDEDV